MAYNKANSGSLYKNSYKKKEDQPDFTGTLHFDAAFLEEMIKNTEVGELVKLSMSGWKGKLPSGESVMNLRIKKPWVKEEKTVTQDDEDVPF
jgi:hypothetical protein